jgi:Putative zinc-finger
VIPPAEWTCEEVASLIHAYAFDRLGGGDAASVEHHLHGCASCESIIVEIGHDTAEVLEATGLRDLPEDLIDLVIAAAAQQGAGQEISLSARAKLARRVARTVKPRGDT